MQFKNNLLLQLPILLDDSNSQLVSIASISTNGQSNHVFESQTLPVTSSPTLFPSQPRPIQGYCMELVWHVELACIQAHFLRKQRHHVFHVSAVERNEDGPALLGAISSLDLPHRFTADLLVPGFPMSDLALLGAVDGDFAPGAPRKLVFAFPTLLATS